MTDVSRRRQFLTLFGLGAVGVVALAVALAPILPESELPLAAFAAIQPTLLLAIAVWVGLRFAPELGFVSRLARVGQSSLSFRAELPLGVGVGVAVGFAIVGLDLWLAPPIEVEDVERRSFALTFAGMLYGGLTEELMMRWGLLSLLTWLAWRTLQGGRGVPGPTAVWSALTLSAVLFGLGHLGAAAALTPLTPLLVARTIALNGLAGVAYGWLYWRRSLECAMVAHASSHLVFALAV